MTILPAAYLPSIEYCARWAQGQCVVDGGEHFVKRSERNRTHILTAGGVLALTVQAVRANRPRTPMRDVRIDYSKRWQHQHWTALVSAYKASPYFDHYAPRFEPFYTRRYEFLFDYDLRLMETIRTARPAHAGRLGSVSDGRRRRSRPAPQTKRGRGLRVPALYSGLLRPPAFHA